MSSIYEIKNIERHAKHIMQMLKNNIVRVLIASQRLRNPLHARLGQDMAITKMAPKNGAIWNNCDLSICLIEFLSLSFFASILFARDLLRFNVISFSFLSSDTFEQMRKGNEFNENFFISRSDEFIALKCSLQTLFSFNSF